MSIITSKIRLHGRQHSQADTWAPQFLPFERSYLDKYWPQTIKTVYCLNLLKEIFQMNLSLSLYHNFENSTTRSSKFTSRHVRTPNLGNSNGHISINIDHKPSKLYIFSIYSMRSFKWTYLCVSYHNFQKYIIFIVTTFRCPSSKCCKKVARHFQRCHFAFSYSGRSTEKFDIW